MTQAQRRSLLPGVSDSTLPPDVRIDSRRIVATARRRALFRETLDLMLLAGVDTFFIRWRHAHVPGIDREHTAIVIAAANALVIGYMWSARALPRWRAWRVSATWSATERRRFLRF
ncbi:MAG TPA: hypothetical protein VL284_10330 [Thermoanaerobaculia bacterium]|nr:hypothetical protein [Thermoanaerobaculia bacterium]